MISAGPHEKNEPTKKSRISTTVIKEDSMDTFTVSLDS